MSFAAQHQPTSPFLPEGVSRRTRLPGRTHFTIAPSAVSSPVSQPKQLPEAPQPPSAPVAIRGRRHSAYDAFVSQSFSSVASSSRTSLSPRTPLNALDGFADPLDAAAEAVAAGRKRGRSLERAASSRSRSGTPPSPRIRRHSSLTLALHDALDSAIKKGIVSTNDHTDPSDDIPTVVLPTSRSSKADFTAPLTKPIAAPALAAPTVTTSAIPRPILSRLPISIDEEPEEEEEDSLSDDDSDTDSEVDEAEPAEATTSSETAGYLVPSSNLPGALPDAAVIAPGLTYTRSRLPEIDGASRELWKALHRLRPLTSDYAGDFTPSRRRLSSSPTSAPHPLYTSAAQSSSHLCPFVASTTPPARTALDLIRNVFNWSEIVLPLSTSGTWYGVVFRSKRAVGSEKFNSTLYLADRRAHEEAIRSGGLLMYVYGRPNENGSNLATCIWTNRAEARRASNLPLHAKAAKVAQVAYASYELSRYKVVKRRGNSQVEIEEWDEKVEGEEQGDEVDVAQEEFGLLHIDDEEPLEA